MVSLLSQKEFEKVYSLKNTFNYFQKYSSNIQENFITLEEFHVVERAYRKLYFKDVKKEIDHHKILAIFTIFFIIKKPFQPNKEKINGQIPDLKKKFNIATALFFSLSVFKDVKMKEYYDIFISKNISEKKQIEIFTAIKKIKIFDAVPKTTNSSIYLAEIINTTYTLLEIKSKNINNINNFSEGIEVHYIPIFSNLYFLLESVYGNELEKIIIKKIKLPL